MHVKASLKVFAVPVTFSIPWHAVNSNMKYE